MVDRLDRAHNPLRRENSDARRGAATQSASDGQARVMLALSDGRTATLRAAQAGIADLVVLDHALDWSRCTRVGAARSDGCMDAAWRLAAGTLQAAGMAVSRLDDLPGLAVLRTVAMLVNEAADVAAQGVAAPAAIDLAMKAGVNYPRGPFEWARALGVPFLAMALQHVAAHYGEDRYRIASRMTRRALTGMPLDAAADAPG
jgi:3-hydroxybutyryl-CoA dehydrogenase